MNGPPRMPRVIQVPSQIPLLGGDKPTQEQIEAAKEQQKQQQLAVAIQQLSMNIYIQKVVKHAVFDGHIEPDSVDWERLRKLAQDAQTAARCYFEGIGVIQEKDNEGASD